MDTHSQTPAIPERLEHPLPPLPDSKSAPWLTYLTYSIVVLVLVALCVGVLFYVAKDSLPGEPLYRVKTEGSEKVQLFMKRSAQSRANYNNSLLESRLTELQVLSRDKSTTTPEVLSEIAQLSSTHINDTFEVLERSNVGFEEKIHLLTPLANLTRTMEVLVDGSGELASIETIIGENESLTNDALENVLVAFVKEGPVERVFEMIRLETQTLAEKSTEVAYGSTAQKAIARRAEDTADALRESNFLDALTYILKAQQAIAVDGYLWNAERGPVDGVPIVPSAIPEGS